MLNVKFNGWLTALSNCKKSFYVLHIRLAFKKKFDNCFVNKKICLETIFLNCQAQGPTQVPTQGQGQGQDMVRSGQVKLRLDLHSPPHHLSQGVA